MGREERILFTDKKEKCEKSWGLLIFHIFSFSFIFLLDFKKRVTRWTYPDDKIIIEEEKRNNFKNGEYNGKAGVHADRRYFMQQMNRKGNPGVLTIEEYLRRKNLIRAEVTKEEESGSSQKEKRGNAGNMQKYTAVPAEWSMGLELAGLLYV